MSRRTEIIDGLAQTGDRWLSIPDGVRVACIASDDRLDALVAGLVAYAAATGRTGRPPSQLLPAARREGWIHLPAADSLADLGSGLGQPT